MHRKILLARPVAAHSQAHAAQCGSWDRDTLSYFRDAAASSLITHLPPEPWHWCERGFLELRMHVGLGVPGSLWVPWACAPLPSQVLDLHPSASQVAEESVSQLLQLISIN